MSQNTLQPPHRWFEMNTSNHSISKEQNFDKWSNGSFIGNDQAVLLGTNEESTRSIARKQQKRPSIFRKKVFGRRLAYFSILVTTIQVAVFIYELVKMRVYTGSAFQTQPIFNPMLGPSSYIQINSGARYLPCMVPFDEFSDPTILFPCANSTALDTNVCSLAELCGLGMEGGTTPNQWWRLITPIFLHAGFIHIISNMILQLTLGARMELHIGFFRYAFIYLAAGIAGNILGANFSQAGLASSGASGALFGAIAINLALLILNQNANHYWGLSSSRIRGGYGLVLGISVLEIIITLVLGLLPGIDNFAHLGGFAMGLGLGVAILNDPKFVYQDEYIYEKERFSKDTYLSMPHFDTFMTKRKRPAFAGWCLVRLLFLVLSILFYSLLLKNLYDKLGEAPQSCSWCKYISCLPVHGWCEYGDISVG